MENTTRTLNPEWPDLIAKTAQGDHEAFSRLYDQSSPQIYGLILRMVNHPQIAEEVAMDVYVQVWKQAQSYDVNRGTAMGWLLAIARTRAIDQLRSGKLKRTSSTRIEDIAKVAFVGASPEEQSSERQRADLVRKALASLPFEQRESLILAYFDGYSQSEISVKLGLPLGTVKTRIRVGMMKLRTVLAPYGMDGAV
ncbi:MAG: sigma-70 family RNA polymerase sigma factor [Nitrospirota bacterium]